MILAEMFGGLFRKFSSLRGEWREINRQCARQRTMLDPGKLVAASLFQDCFNTGSRPGAPTQLEKLSRLFDLQNDDLGTGCAYMVVPSTLLTKPEQESHGAVVARSQEKLQEKLRDIDRAERKTIESKDPYDAYNLPLYDMQRQSVGEKIASLPGGDTAKLCWLEDLLGGGDEDKLPGSSPFFQLATALSVLRGEGRVMVDFWKAVNALEDYSHHFSRGGGGKRIRSALPATQPSLQPVPLGIRA